MKRKTLTLCLSLLACLSLIGVGFAAWVISGGDTQDAAGNITVETVVDERYSISKPTISDSLHYGMKADASISNPWLLDDNNAVEKLTITFDVTVTAKTALEGSDKAAWDAAVSVTGIIVEPTSTAYTAAKTANAIAKPEVSVVYKEGQTPSNTSAVYTVTITGKWGTELESTNPYSFYNGKDMNGEATVNGEQKTWADHAAYILGLIEKIASAETDPAEGPTTKYTLKLTVAAV